MKRLYLLLFGASLLLSHPAAADEVDTLIADLKAQHALVADMRKEEKQLEASILETQKLQAQLAQVERLHATSVEAMSLAVTKYNEAKAQLPLAIEHDMANLQAYQGWIYSVVSRALFNSLTLKELDEMSADFAKKRGNDQVCGRSERAEVIDRMGQALINASLPAGRYHTEASVLVLPAEYAGYVAQARANSKALVDQVAKLRVDLDAAAPALTPPHLCGMLDDVARLIALRGVMLDARETGEDLSAIEFDLVKVLEGVETEEKAIAYAGAVKRSVNAMQGRFAVHLNNLNAMEAAQIADNASEARAMLLDGVRKSGKLSPAKLATLESETLATVNAIVAQAEQKLGPQSAYRGLVLLRTKRMQARLFAIDQKPLTPAQKASWTAVRDGVKASLGFPAAGLFKLPLYTTRDELVSFESKVAEAEKQITALGVEN